MIHVQVDGATRGNPGMSGAGIVIKHHNRVAEYSIPLGVHTNHEAEFLAVIRALQICHEHYPNQMIALQTDSKLVVDAIDKQYVKNKLFRPLLHVVIKEKERFPLFFIKWIPSSQNKHADRLARRAIDKQRT